MMQSRAMSMMNGMRVKVPFSHSHGSKRAFSTEVSKQTAPDETKVANVTEIVLKDEHIDSRDYIKNYLAYTNSS